MTITLKPETEQYLRERARELGLHDPSLYVERLLDRERDQDGDDTGEISDEELRKTDAWRVVERMKGTATRGLTADQIMAETRSEV